jgi:hypothetical protein
MVVCAVQTTNRTTNQVKITNQTFNKVESKFQKLLFVFLFTYCFCSICRNGGFWDDTVFYTAEHGSEYLLWTPFFNVYFLTFPLCISFCLLTNNAVFLSQFFFSHVLLHFRDFLKQASTKFYMIYTDMWWWCSWRQVRRMLY